MAPTKPPSAREKRMARIRGEIPSHAPRKTHRPDAVVSDGFSTTKQEKRMMKHSILLSKVQKSATASSKTLKRRRPNKKLVATLESLADALPELNESELSRPADGKIRHKSLRTRPGALKRKERLVRGEMARFGASMAALTALPASEATTTASTSGMEVESKESTDAPESTSTPAPSMSNRWAALRRHITSTMEQNPAFTSASQDGTSGNG